MTEELLENFKGKIGEVALIPSSGGVFEVSFNEQLIFSKKELNRFPESEEVCQLIKEKNLIEPSG